MRLSCPNCQTEYEVPDAALTGRTRLLRCAKCLTEWRVPAAHTDGEQPWPASEASAESAPAEPGSAEPRPVEHGPEHGPVEHGPLEPAAVEPAAAQSPEEPAASTSPAQAAPAATLEMSRPASAPEQPRARAERSTGSKTRREDQPRAASDTPRNRGLLLSVLVVVLLIAAVLADHRQIGNFWPPSLRLFNALGLH